MSTATLCSVETKLKAGFVCEHRPLRPGERPKRPGQDTVFEATGEVCPELMANLKAYPYYVTVKHDGMCSKIVVDNGKTSLFKRYDVRKGKSAPSGSVPAGTNDFGDVEFHWINVTEDFAPDNQYYHSTTTRGESGDIEKVSLVYTDENGGYKFVDVPPHKIPTGTYELIGPKVQGNPYRLPADIKVPTFVMRKVQIEVEKHYFIRHGSVEINEVFHAVVTDFTLENIRNFIVSRRIEGLVLHFPEKCMFKINRGHIGVELTKDDVLQINLG